MLHLGAPAACWTWQEYDSRLISFSGANFFFLFVLSPLPVQKPMQLVARSRLKKGGRNEVVT